MTQEPAPTGDTIFTIGHSNHSLDHFLDLLRQHGIEAVVDLRSDPFSSYTPHFNGTPLGEALRVQGFHYLYLGRELGGRPEDPKCFDAEGYVLYDRMAALPTFRQAFARLQQGVEKYRVALLCSEEDPATCHRHLLLARVCRQEGIEVRHIRGDGRLDSFEDAEEHYAAGAGVNAQGLLPGMEDSRQWKSIRSVLQKSPPPSSSDESETPECGG